MNPFHNSTYDYFNSSSPQPRQFGEALADHGQGHCASNGMDFDLPLSRHSKHSKQRPRSLTVLHSTQLADPRTAGVRHSEQRAGPRPAIVTQSKQQTTAMVTQSERRAVSCTSTVAQSEQQAIQVVSSMRDDGKNDEQRKSVSKKSYVIELGKR